MNLAAELSKNLDTVLSSTRRRTCEMLRIERFEDQKRGGASASVRFLQMNLPKGVNCLEVSENPDKDTLVHEVTISPRLSCKKYVKYDCTKVMGYGKALTCAIGKYVKTAKDLCEDMNVAKKCNFMGSQFIKNSPGIGEYDINSVMHYSSKTQSNQGYLLSHQGPLFVGKLCQGTPPISLAQSPYED
ncbi:hypothetical protein BCR34DRAFT_587091 [Clohesyomyces aquaticus]|uniref:Peptidase M12A domain-containing protein n=1 Tax=Clohesyomyces aquaticus TaxID=1231657 RepID=A0A1Y1ZQT9_9PLEO|nr:hypothetical protein BCR34DRAFT_587091 [Clohesyomyces aquaticus]